MSQSLYEEPVVQCISGPRVDQMPVSFCNDKSIPALSTPEALPSKLTPGVHLTGEKAVTWKENVMTRPGSARCCGYCDITGRMSVLHWFTEMLRVL